MKKIYTILVLSLLLCCAVSAKRHKTIERPTTGWSNTRNVEVGKVELSDTATVLQFDIFQYPGENFTFAKESYIQTGEKKYTMKGCTGFTPGKYTNIPDSGHTTVRLVFPPVDKKVKSLDFIEYIGESGWKIFNIDLTGKRAVEEFPEGLPDEFKTQQTDFDAALPEPILETGTTTVRVHILGYRPEMGKEIRLLVNDFYPYGQQRGFTATVSDEGLAEFSFPQYGTTEAFLVRDRRTLCSSLWLKPGETAEVYADPMAIVRMDTEKNYHIKNSKQHILAYHRGHYAALNNAYEKYYPGGYRLELYSGEFADYRMTTDEYVAHVMRQYKEKKAKLDAETNFPRMLKELTEFKLKGDVVKALIKGDVFLVHNYRHVHGQWDYSKPVDYKFPEFHVDQLTVLKTLGLDSPKCIYTQASSSICDGPLCPDVSGASLLSTHTDGFLSELDKVKQYPSDIHNMKFLTEEQEQVLSSLKYKFFADVCHSVQNDVKAKLEEQKSKSGYMVCDIPEVPDSALFDAIAERYRGKVVIVDFWATWCAPCKAMIKEMEPMKDKELNDKDLMFVYLTGESSPEATWRTMIGNIRGHHYRMSQQQWDSVYKKFNIAYIPSYVLIQKDGSYSLCNDLMDHAKAVRLVKEALAK